MSALPRESFPGEARDGSPARRAGLPVRLAYYAGVILAAVFLVVSMLSWSLPLAGCSLVLAIVLFRNIDLVGGTDDHRPTASPAPTQN